MNIWEIVFFLGTIVMIWQKQLSQYFFSFLFLLVSLLMDAQEGNDL